MKNYLLTVYDESEYNAGPKAKRDIEEILVENKNFESVNFYFDLDSKIKKIKYSIYDIPKKMRSLKKGNLFIQYPIYSSVITDKILSTLPEEMKIYYIIHDVESLRLFKNSVTYKKGEIRRLNSAQGIISHNKVMTKWLKENGVSTEIVDLEIFDYLSNFERNSRRKYNKKICFAGNLAKSEFLKKFPQNTNLAVYGPNPNEDYPKNIEYKGVYKPEDLPNHLTENFGLVWDGKNGDKCDGVFGEYMQYNNPHKVSLYLSTDLPVIIWSKAAAAGFIKENNLGIVIDNLDEIIYKLNKITNEDYERMLRDVSKISRNLKDGFYIQKAVDKLLDS